MKLMCECIAAQFSIIMDRICVYCTTKMSLLSALNFMKRKLCEKKSDMKNKTQKIFFQFVKKKNFLYFFLTFFQLIAAAKRNC